jgi:hypothetical protein
VIGLDKRPWQVSSRGLLLGAGFACCDPGIFHLNGANPVHSVKPRRTRQLLDGRKGFSAAQTRLFMKEVHFEGEKTSSQQQRPEMNEREAVVSSQSLLSRFANSRTEESSPSTSKFAMENSGVHRRRQEDGHHANRGNYGTR